jgi:uncharacterized protein
MAMPGASRVARRRAEGKEEDEGALNVRRLHWLVLVLVACGGDAPDDRAESYTSVLPFDTANVRLVSSTDTAMLTLELAESTEQHTLGLMERRSLAANAGMLFVYPNTQPESSAFWMFRTRIPLDIAFIDSAGVIRTIQTMKPCESRMIEGCPSYPAGAPYRVALEMNAGYFAQNRVNVGDRVLLQDTVNRRRAK